MEESLFFFGIIIEFILFVIKNLDNDNEKRSSELFTQAARVRKEEIMFSWQKLLFWSWQPESERESGDAVVKNFCLHWFPAKVSWQSFSAKYSLWLGTITASLFLILCVTGVVLMFLYVPSVERAYGSVKDLEHTVSFGAFLRGLHRIAANLMVVFVFLHLMRVFLTGAYRSGATQGANRPINWIVGVMLLLLTLLLSFTGYLLPWDQLAYWAITVGTNIAKAVPVVGDFMRMVLLGGNEIGQSTLIRFYVLHCVFLPAAVLFLFVYHMWRIRKDGGLACVDHQVLQEKKQSVPPAKTKTYSLLGITKGTSVQVENTMVDEEVHLMHSVPHLPRRILLVFLLTWFACIVVAVFVGAPLEEPANPYLTPNPAKAPWYFLWLQELVTDTTVQIGSFTLNGALVGGVILPGILVLILLLWPYLDRTTKTTVGVWFARERKWQNALFLLVTFMILVLTIVGTFLRGPYWNFYWPWQDWPEMPRKF